MYDISFFEQVFTEKDLGQLKKSESVFNAKFITKFSQIYDWIQDPRSRIRKKLILDPGFRIQMGSENTGSRIRIRNTDSKTIETVNISSWECNRFVG